MTEAIYIMWVRQVKQFWRSKPRLVGSLAQPLLFLIALGLGFGPIFEKAGGGDYVQYLTPGIISMTLLFGSLFNGISVIWDKQFGFLKETLVAPVSRIELLLGRCLGGATIATFSGLVVLAISYLLGFRMQNLLLLPFIILFMLLIALFFNLLGTIIASKLDDMQGFHLVMNFIVMPTFFFSGALFPLENLPPILEHITRVNPLAYGVDGLRALLIGTSTTNLATNLIVLSAITLVILAIGKLAFDRIET